MQKLVKIAASALSSKLCVKVEKYINGIYNKAFFLIINNGKKAMAKIPNSNIRQLYLTIASEIATMNFINIMLRFSHIFNILQMRNVFKTPISKVYI